MSPRTCPFLRLTLASLILTGIAPVARAGGDSPERAAAFAARRFDGVHDAGAAAVEAGPSPGAAAAGPRAFADLSSAAPGAGEAKVPPAPVAVRETRPAKDGGRSPAGPGWGALWDDWFAKAWEVVATIDFGLLLAAATGVWIATLAGLIQGGLVGMAVTFVAALMAYLGFGLALLLGTLFGTAIATAVASGGVVLAKKLLSRLKRA